MGSSPVSIPSAGVGSAEMPLFIQVRRPIDSVQLYTIGGPGWVAAASKSTPGLLQVRCKKHRSNIKIVHRQSPPDPRSSTLSHTVREKNKLLNRVSRLRGQIEAIERALEREVECAEVLQLIASARGAMNGLMAEVMEDHIRAHVLDPEHGHDSDRMRGAEELIDVVRAYLK
jgi:DNA-binding FrmR family transcriptional regulator